MCTASVSGLTFFVANSSSRSKPGFRSRCRRKKSSLWLFLDLLSGIRDFLSLPASRLEFQCKDIKEIQKHIQFGSSGPGGLHHPVWAHRVRSWLPLMTRCFQVPGVQESALFQPEAARCHWQSETPRGLHSRSGRTVVDQPCCHLGRGDSLVKPWPLRSFELSRPRS